MNQKWGIFVAVLVVLVQFRPPMDAEVVMPARDNLLEGLNAAQLAAMDTADVAPYYAARMSNAFPPDPWVSLVDADIEKRPAAEQILSELLAQPAHEDIRHNIWSWLSKHPSFPVTPHLFEQSMDLYKTEHLNWRWKNRSGFAKFIAVFGTAREAPIMEELARGHGPGVDVAKAIFDKRMNALASPSGSGAANGAQLKPQPPPTTQTLETKPLIKDGEPTTAASWFGWRLLFAVMVAIGLLWAVLKKRR